MKFKEMKKLHPLINHKSNHYDNGSITTIEKMEQMLSATEMIGYAKGNVLKYDEHKSYFMGYESETERIGGFGSSGN